MQVKIDHQTYGNNKPSLLKILEHVFEQHKLARIAPVSFLPERNCSFHAFNTPKPENCTSISGSRAKKNEKKTVCGTVTNYN